jgi:hypothetical protein
MGLILRKGNMLQYIATTLYLMITTQYSQILTQLAVETASPLYPDTASL